MTTRTMDQLNAFPSVPRRFIRQDETNNTQSPKVVSRSAANFEDEAKASASVSLPFSLYVTNLLWNNIAPKTLSNESSKELSVSDTVSKNATVESVVPEELEEELSVLISNIRNQNFDDILEADVAVSLTNIIDNRGKLVLDLLYTWFISNRVDSTTASEIVTLIGRIDTSATLARRNFLELCLQVSSSARIRYAAILGLSDVDDPASMESIKTAIGSEPLASMRKDMKQLLTQLEKTSLENK